MADGYIYRLDYSERMVNNTITQINVKAIEFSDSDESTVRSYLAGLQGECQIQDVSLRRRLPTPAWEDLTV